MRSTLISDLNITWLRDANVKGPMNWAPPVAWADNFSFGGCSDWRLPTSDQCLGYSCRNREMAHLFYVKWGEHPRRQHRKQRRLSKCAKRRLLFWHDISKQSKRFAIFLPHRRQPEERHPKQQAFCNGRARWRRDLDRPAFRSPKPTR